MLFTEDGKLLLVKLNNRFRTHNASSNWRPLGVEAADTLLSNEAEIKDLVATKSHDENGVFFLAIHIDVLDRHDSSVHLIRSQLDVV